MARPSLNPLAQVQQALQGYLHAPHWYLALSGGLDSSVLLHLLAQWRQQQSLPPLTAVHVYHGLQAVAADWPAHCAQQCQALGINFQLLEVQVAPGASLEAAAREARYKALASLLTPGALLLTAQHAEDQAETFLFRVLRGAGVRGLAAMPRVRPLGAGLLVRPLLGCRRGELEQYAQQNRQVWVEDPTNRDLRFSRNYLRHEVVPRLVSHWPQATASLARAAEHMAETQTLLDELAQQDLAAMVDEPNPWAWLGLPQLPLAALRSLSEARQRNLLRHWLSSWTALPDTAHWAGWQTLRDAAPEATPEWRLAQGILVRAEGWIWFLPPSWYQSLGTALPAVIKEEPLCLPNNGCIWVQGPSLNGLHLSYRQGGEQMQVPGRGRRDLKRLLNEQGVPVFVRHRLPLLWQDEVLVAVANLPALSVSDWSVRWQPPGLS